MNNYKKLLSAVAVAAFSSSVLAVLPPEPPFHPSAHFSNQSAEAVHWDVEGDHGEAVYVTNSPINPVPAKVNGVDFEFYVAFGASGYDVVSWGSANQYRCSFSVGAGGVGDVRVQSNDPKYRCEGGDAFGVYPAS